jgi:hypothetical protein
MRKFALLVGLHAICLALFPEESFAQVQAHFSYDAIANCEKPNVRNRYMGRERVNFQLTEMRHLLFGATLAVGSLTMFSSAHPPL